MRKRILSLCLAVVTLLVLGSCGEGDKSNSIEQIIVASSSNSGDVNAAKDFAKSINAQHVEFSSDSDAIVAVLNGRADYVILDEYAGYAALKENKSLSFYKKCDYGVDYRACFTSENTELCEDFNEAFAKLAKDGTIDDIKSAVYNNEQYEIIEPSGDKGTLVMICDPIFDNRLYFQEDGTVTGTEVYIAKEVCNYLGYTLVIKHVNFEDMFAALDAGEGDFIMSCMERTDQRAEQYLFSNVYASFDYNAYKLK